jgi:hypothetical protein
MPALPTLRGRRGAIAEYTSRPAVHVITTPAGLLDRVPTRPAARLVLEIIEKLQNSLTCATDVWLATQKVIRRDSDAAEARNSARAASRPGGETRPGQSTSPRCPRGCQRRSSKWPPRPGGTSSGNRARTWSPQRQPRSFASRAARGTVPDVARAVVASRPDHCLLTFPRAVVGQVSGGTRVTLLRDAVGKRSLATVDDAVIAARRAKVCLALFDLGARPMPLPS